VRGPKQGRSRAKLGRGIKHRIRFMLAVMRNVELIMELEESKGYGYGYGYGYG
jgi:hypothetical protein